MGNVAQSRLTTYFQTHHAWDIPWGRIRLVREGWAIRAGRLLCADNNATTIALPGRYEVHYREPLAEATLAHEIFHIFSMKKMGAVGYVLDYARQLIRVGYRNITHEIEARRCANEYAIWSQGH